MSDEVKNPNEEIVTPTPETALDWAKLPGEKPPEPFVRTVWDRVFALVFYAVGYVYVDRILLYGRYWYVTAFTAFYAAAVLGYFFLKGVKPRPISWFWLAVLLSVGGSFALYHNASLLGFDLLVLHGVAMYWPLCAGGATLRGGTSSLLPWDLLNSFITIPFGNFFSLIRSIFGGWNVKKEGLGKRVWSVILGIAALIALLFLVLPMLASADAGFEALLANLDGLFRLEWDTDTLFRLILALPVSFYLFGHAYGSVNGRHTRHLKAERVAEWSQDCRVLPNTTVYIVLTGICAVYVVFIALQAQNLFSAFAGKLSGTSVYSEFAREGFFDLCRVAAINGVILLLSDLLASSGRAESRALRVFNIILAALTLLILASAARKMILYIQVYGLTAKRVLTMAFMAMLAVLYGGVIVWQKKSFNLIRLAVVFAAVLFCVLALCNLDHWILLWNTAHNLPM